jgi:hypothetical protein
VTWDENDPTMPTQPQRPRREVVDLDTLDDGRCKASSWSGRKPAKPTYENHFGPGGYNRCIGSDGHPNPTHKDDWGYVFIQDPEGHVRTLRREEPSAGA